MNLHLLGAESHFAEMKTSGWTEQTQAFVGYLEIRASPSLLGRGFSPLNVKVPAHLVLVSSWREGRIVAGKVRFQSSFSTCVSC